MDLAWTSPIVFLERYTRLLIYEHKWKDKFSDQISSNAKKFIQFACLYSGILTVKTSLIVVSCILLAIELSYQPMILQKLGSIEILDVNTQSHWLRDESLDLRELHKHDSNVCFRFWNNNISLLTKVGVDEEMQNAYTILKILVQNILL